MSPKFIVLCFLVCFSSFIGFSQGTSEKSFPEFPPYQNEAFAPFYHGVASGDPGPDRVILWTRITGSSEQAEVKWEVALDPEMKEIVSSGTHTTSQRKDYTVKVDVTGLESGRWYFYRFLYEGQYSVIGRTKTLPMGETAQVKFAVLSCGNYSDGYFSAYRAVAEHGDLDAVLYLGDYIYEYPGHNKYGRMHFPPKEIVTLDDYRQRYSQYRLDHDLMRLHQVYPFIAIWDDHETANNSWKEGAENHDDGEGDWETRKGEALQAYYEWMPVREPDLGGRAHAYRHFEFGDLADLLILETRLAGREEQSTRKKVADDTRDLLGSEQWDWLGAKLDVADGRWTLFGQQTMLAPLTVPFLRALNTDQWDGYPGARKRFYDSLQVHQVENPVVLTGDIHTAWACDLPGDKYKPRTGANSLGVEFITSSVSSYNMELKIATRPFRNQNPHIKYNNMKDHGYILLTLNSELCRADYYFMENIYEPGNYKTKHLAALETRSGSKYLIKSSNPPTTNTADQAFLPKPIPHVPVQDGFDVLNIYQDPKKKGCWVQVHLYSGNTLDAKFTHKKKVSGITDTGLSNTYPEWLFFPGVRLDKRPYDLKIEGGGMEWNAKVWLESPKGARIVKYLQ